MTTKAPAAATAGAFRVFRWKAYHEAMGWRNRIKEHRVVRAGDIAPNKKNWRVHPAAQTDALRRALETIGVVDEVLCVERRGRLVMIDGHARQSLDPDAEVPVAVLDLTDNEVDLLLASFDSVTSMAMVDAAALTALLEGIKATDDTTAKMLEDIARANRLGAAAARVEAPTHYEQAFHVQIECRDEDDQRAVYEDMTRRGYKCRLLML